MAVFTFSGHIKCDLSYDVFIGNQKEADKINSISENLSKCLFLLDLWHPLPEIKYALADMNFVNCTP